MKRINQKELYQNLAGFLKAKGIELKEGSYTERIQKGCTLLADAVNLTQEQIAKARTTIDGKLDQMRQVIHEKTAPNPPAATSAPKSPSGKGGRAASKTAKRKTSPGPKKRGRKA